MPEIFTTNAIAPVQGYRFGVFEFHTDTCELWRNGARVRLAQQPARLLRLLLEHAGELITREEIKRQLWPPETFVDFDNSVNSAVNRIRQALRDTADNPRYIETHPRLGYRFNAPVTPIQARPKRQEAVPAPPEVVEDGNEPALPVADQAAATAIARAKLRSVWLWAGAGAALLALGVGNWLYARRPRWPQIVSFRQITFDGRMKLGREFPRPLLSDGPRIYFSEQTQAGRSLMYTGLKGGTPLPLTALLPDLYLQAISPDGQRVLATQPRTGGKLWTLDLPDGEPRAVQGIFAHAACWSPRGRRIAYSWQRQIWIMNAHGQHRRQIASLPATPWWLRWSPDGRQLRFTLGNPSADNARIWQFNLRTRRLRPLSSANSCCGDWTRNGGEYFFQAYDITGSDIYVLPRHSLQPRAVTAGPISFQSPTPIPGSSRLLVLGESTQPELMRYKASAARFEPFLHGISAIWVSFSPDRRRIAYETVGARRNAWLARADNSHPRQITYLPLDCEGLAWSPDGRRLVIRARLRKQDWHLYIYSLAQQRLEELPRAGSNVGIASWSPHGRRLVYGGLPDAYGHFSTHGGIHVYGLTSGTRTTLPSSSGLWTARWSPNGRWIAALRDHTQRLELYSVQARHWRRTAILNVDNPTWSRQGHYLYFDSLGEDLGFFRYDPASGQLKKMASLNRYGWLADGWSGLDGRNRPLVARIRGLDEIYSLRWKLR